MFLASRLNNLFCFLTSEDSKQCVEHIEENDQAIEVQQYETEAMVNEERAPENVNPRSQEPRLVTEKEINQTEGKANEEMEDAPQRGAQELRIVTGRFESKRMDFKEKVELVQDRTQEVSHAAVKDVNKTRIGFDQVDSEGKVLFILTRLCLFFPLQKKREKTGTDVTILVSMDNIVSCDVLASFSAIKIVLFLLNRHVEVLRLFRFFQLNPLVIIVTANIQVN